MKKIYIKPLLEIANGICESRIMEGSNFYHGEAREDDFFNEETNEETIKSRNLWDE